MSPILNQRSPRGFAQGFLALPVLRDHSRWGKCSKTFVPAERPTGWIGSDQTAKGTQHTSSQAGSGTASRSRTNTTLRWTVITLNSSTERWPRRWPSRQANTAAQARTTSGKKRRGVANCLPLRLCSLLCVPNQLPRRDLNPNLQNQNLSCYRLHHGVMW